MKKAISMMLATAMAATCLAGCGSGAGVKVEPMGFLIVKDGNVRMLNVMPPASNTFDRLIDMTPQVFDRIDRFIDQRKADKA